MGGGGCHSSRIGLRPGLLPAPYGLVTTTIRGNSVTVRSLLPGDAPEDERFANCDASAFPGHDAGFLPGTHLLVDGLPRTAHEPPQIGVRESDFEARSAVGRASV